MTLCEGNPKNGYLRVSSMTSKLSLDQMNELFYIAGYKPPIRTREMLIPCDVPDWAIVLFGHFYLESKNYDSAILEFDKLVKDFISKAKTSSAPEQSLLP
jgi:hypothetical protein